MPKLTFPVEGEDMPATTTFLAVTPSMRLRIATAIENLIALLDQIDGDTDLEDGGDHEPDETDCDLAGAMTDLEHDNTETGVYA